MYISYDAPFIQIKRGYDWKKLKYGQQRALAPKTLTWNPPASETYILASDSAFKTGWVYVSYGAQFIKVWWR